MSIQVALSTALLFLGPCVFASSKFVCVNKTDLQTKFEVSLSRSGASLSGATTNCDSKYIAYKPLSPRYKDWVRVAPIPSENGCKAFYSEVLGKPYDGETADIHWLSISREMQLGQEGFAQLGVENTADPGSGGTAKIFVRCFPI